MSVTSVQLWQLLESSGLMSAEEGRSLAAEMANEVSADQMLEATSVANWLIQRKRISGYQAKVLLGQKSGPLRCGSYIVQAELTDRTLPNWYRTSHESAEGEYWLLALPESYLNTPEFQENPPSLRLARAHAKVRDPMLSALSEPQLSDGYLCVASSMLSGRTLASTMQGVVMPAATARAIIIQAAMALDRLHEANLIHGDIGLHSIWWDGDQTICLARDPLFLPCNPMVSATSLSVIQAPQTERLRYAAPEFAAPGQQPSFATDLYALGCVWYELLTGQSIVPESQPVAMIKAIMNQPRSTVRAAGFDKHSQRLLDHLIAKNPDARFSSARQFLQALQVASSPAQAIAETTPVSTAKASSIAVEPKQPVSVNQAKTDAAETERKVWQDEPQKIAAKAREVEADITSMQSTAGQIPVKDTRATKATEPASEVQPTKKKVAPETRAPAESQLSKSPPVAKAVASEAIAPKKQAANQDALKPTSKPAESESKLPQADTKSPVVAKPPATTSASVAPTTKADVAATNTTTKTDVAADATTNSTATASSDKIEQTAAPKPTAPSKSSAKPPAKKSSARTKKSKKKKPVWFLPAAGAISLILVLGLTFALMYSGETTVTKTKRVPDSSALSQESNPAPKPSELPPPPIDPIASEYNLVEDDQLTLWAPPNIPDPIQLTLLPPGLQGALFLNVARIAQQPEYESLHDVLGPSYQMLTDHFSKNLPVQFVECNHLLVGLYPSDTSEWPDLVLRVDLKESKAIEELLTKYSFTTPIEEIKLGSTSYQRNSNSNVAVLLQVDTSDATKCSRMIVGPPKLIQELVAIEGGLAPLTRQLEVLRQNSCVANDFTYFTTTSLLLSSGRGVLQSSLAGLLPYLRVQMQEDVAALGVSVNIDDLWYGELRIVGKDAQTAPAIQTKLKETLQALPDQAESALPSFSSNPYWAKLAFRLPQQLRTWQSNVRTGIEAEHAVANFYLPTKATSNLLMSSWMALRTPIAAPSIASTTTAPAAKPLTMEEILKVPVTIGFDQESLEAGSKEIANAFNASLNNPLSAIQIEIDGAALEKDGITRNQQIRDFKHENKPFREVLISLVRKANPVTTVQNPNEKDQKLVWVIKDAEQRIIQVTTRTAADAASLTLPEEFVLPKEPGE